MPRSAGSTRRQGIPEHVRVTLRKRLERHARERWDEHCRAIDVRFRGSFAYVDALQRYGRICPIRRRRREI